MKSLIISRPGQLQRLSYPLGNLSEVSVLFLIMVLIRLCGCVGWSAPLVFICNRGRDSHDLALPLGIPNIKAKLI